MRDALRLVVAVVATIFTFATPLATAAPQQGEVEASMNFDLAGVRPFMMRLGAVVEGFEAAQASALAEDIAKLRVETTLTRTYAVKYKGKPVSLRVEVFMDDVDAPDIFFYTEQVLADQINVELRSFAEAHGW